MTPEQWEELGCYQDEHYLVNAIRTHLLTPEQRQSMSNLGITIEDVLNGRTPQSCERFVSGLMEEWNDSLGWGAFGV